MYFSVREFLKQHSTALELSDVEVIAGESGLENEIKGVTIIEAPDIVRFIEGGEVLLTGLYAFRSCSLEEFKNYISDMHEKSVSALFLKQGRRVENADEKIELLARYCNDHSIPLINVPFQVSFQKIMSAILEQLFNEEVTRLKYYKLTHDNFCALSLTYQKSDTAIYRILDMLDKLIRNPVAIFDDRYSCLSSSNTKYDEMCWTSDTHKIDPNIISRNIYYKQKGQHNKYIVEIMLSTGRTVFLQVWEVVSEFSQMDLIAIENAIVALQYEFSRQYSISELEQKFQNDLIHNILVGNLASKDEIERSQVFTGLNLEDRYRVLSIGFAQEEERKGFNERVVRINQLKECILDIIKNCPLHYSLDGIAIIHRVNPQTDQTKQRSIYRDLFRQIKEQYMSCDTGGVLVCGVGRAVNGLNDIRKSYQEANDALAFLEINSNYQNISDEALLFFSDLGIFKLLFSIKDRETLESFIPESLLSLYRSDSKQRSELIQTLESYLKNQLNLAKTAKELFIHYKTAMYRLNRICEITGIDFTNEKEVLSIRVGLVVFHLLERKTIYEH